MIDEIVDMLRVFELVWLVMVAVESSRCTHGIKVFHWGTHLQERPGVLIVDKL
jgi:hypothetical protein